MARGVLFVLCALALGACGRIEQRNGSDVTDNGWTSEGDLKKSYSNGTGHISHEEKLHVLQGYNELLTGINDTGDVSTMHFCSSLMDSVRAKVCNVVISDINSKSVEKPSMLEVWGLGFAFVTLINLSSVLGVIFLPMMNKKFYKKLLMVMVGLAVGSLSASSVFHLVPQAFRLVDDPTHGYLNISLMLWIGVWVFFMVERILRIVATRRHFSGLSPVPEKESSALSSSTEGTSEGDDSGEYGHSHTHHHQHAPLQFRPGKDNAVATVAWMVVFGDGFHNFIDGLSIGAAFNESTLTGVSISVAVLCEELPHELGDFAVLLSAGMTMRQALVANFLSACTCYAGLVLGILLGEFEASVYVFGFAAGMFLYISLVDMMPELNAAAEDASKRSARAAASTLLLQNVGLLAGCALLFSLARFQDGIQLW